MSIFKCKMCGGTIEFEPGATVGVCDSCGTKQTLPRLDDEKRANLYDRANHFRRNNEFDKAAAIYEQILNEDTTDAEAYWSLVLCRYGIEYVEDPQSHKRVPTVNRAQFTSIFADEDYKSALQYADGYQRTIYEEEAKAIDDIQKGILAISQKEEPFDVFICYKETDANGRRTPDSVLANDLYYQLTQEGFKVFFARITLEDKLGTAYEPYIFAALNSAKVMVVLGTKPEHFNAVWVKNEWSRYLALVKKSGGKKILIPAYKDMDPYDLPEEFSHLQAQDMSKLGFMQDLVRGIKKIAKADEPKATVRETVVVGGGNADVAPLLERAFLFLEDGKWQDADTYCEKVLDIDPKNAEAYLGKLMVELQVKNRKLLADYVVPFDKRDNFNKIIRFGDEKLKAEVRGYITHIIYNDGVKAMNAAKTKDDYLDAMATFLTIPDCKDIDEPIAVCQGKIKEFEAREEAERQKAEIERQERERQAEIERQEREQREREGEIWWGKALRIAKKAAIIATPIVCAIIAFIIVLNVVIIPNGKYNDAIALMDAGNIDEAYSIFIELGDYKDAADKVANIRITKEKEQLKNAKAGSYVTFGAYEQDKNIFNGKEDIEWLVLEVKDGRVLVVSKYALDCKLYDTTATDEVTWETCTLREWLNDYFIYAAFSDHERSMIPTVTVSADKNPKYSTNPGNATKDRVFLLSIREVNQYFSSDEARRCVLTAYAQAHGRDTSWWLRSPGDSLHSAATVGIWADGSIEEDGWGVNVTAYAVRPALWIDLNS